MPKMSCQTIATYLDSVLVARGNVIVSFSASHPARIRRMRLDTEPQTVISAIDASHGGDVIIATDMTTRNVYALQRGVSSVISWSASPPIPTSCTLVGDCLWVVGRDESGNETLYRACLALNGAFHAGVALSACTATRPILNGASFVVAVEHGVLLYDSILGRLFSLDESGVPTPVLEGIEDALIGRADRDAFILYRETPSGTEVVKLQTPAVSLEGIRVTNPPSDPEGIALTNGIIAITGESGCIYTARWTTPTSVQAVKIDWDHMLLEYLQNGSAD